MKALFYFILTIVFLGSCASSTTEAGVAKESLSKYAVGFHLYEHNDSMVVLSGDKHFVYAKSVKNTFVISSSTQLTFLKEMGCFSDIIGLFDANIYSDSLLLDGLKKGKILSFKNAASPDWEALSAHSKSIVLGYKHFPLHEKTVENLNLNVVPINEYMEEHPLGKAEWIKVIGVLSGKYAAADSIFKTIEAKYNAVKSTAKQNGVKVMAGEYYDGYWSVPGSSSYVALMIRDAGGEYLVKNISQSTLQMNKESFAELLKSAQYWRKLTPMDWQAKVLSKEEVRLQFDVYPTQMKGILYCDVNKTAYFEKALLHPDEELQDLITELNGGEGKIFYRLIKVD